VCWTWCQSNATTTHNGSHILEHYIKRSVKELLFEYCLRFVGDRVVCLLVRLHPSVNSPCVVETRTAHPPTSYRISALALQAYILTIFAQNLRGSLEQQQRKPQVCSHL